jgi:uncharacterized protein YjiS (DUF1127 family)
MASSLLYQYKSKEAQMPHARTDTLPLRPRTSLLRRMTDALSDAATRRRDRKALAQLDPHLLRDIGIDAEDARVESTKPFWQP